MAEMCETKSFEEKLKEIIAPEKAMRIAEKLEFLLQHEWDKETSENTILDAFSIPSLPNNFPEILCNTLDVAFDYGLTQEYFIQMLGERRNFDTLNHDLFKRFVDYSDDTAMQTSSSELIEEIKLLNPSLNENFLRNDFEKIKSIYRSLQSASEKEILSWANDIKKNLSSCLYWRNKIAYVWKAMELSTKLKIRDVQVLTVLMMYRYGRGQLAQVNTGEGKTVIIAMLAALLCLDGHQVDMVTTSPELAVPQSQQLDSFYQLLGLSSSNIDKGDKLVAYKYDVVYGSINEFEGDVLHDEFLKAGTRAGRKFDIVIIDEADSMLVDGINNVTRLSSPMPGMNTLLPILIKIWDLFVTSQIPADAAAENMTAFETVTCAIENELDKDKIENEVRNLIQLGQLRVPKHLMDFVLNHQLKIWVRSAFTAEYQLRRDREYVIEDKEVKIVDLHNSGIVFKNMKWSDGIHQFLQIKNNVQLTCEDLVTNFLGNPTFFLKYKKKIYGVSGTLGCRETRNFLEKSYNIDTIVVPPFKAKQHYRLSPILVQSKDAWYKTIVDKCMTKLGYGRAVLIIADSIAETNEIQKNFLDAGFENILMYQTEKDSKICEKLINPGQVVITTNICGRGVNIFSSSEARGGLHICLTFLPENSRVEDQNIGRTSRSGNPGTSQLILLNGGIRKLDDIKRQRDETNARKLEAMFSDLERTAIKAKVFDQFCAFLKNVERTIQTSKDWKDNRSCLQPDQLCGAIKEKFSIWLKINESLFHENPDELLNQYFVFERSLSDISSVKATENLFFYILSGVKCLQKQNYEVAIQQFSKAIIIDKSYSAFAYLNRAVSYVAVGRLEEAVSDLEEAKTGISQIMYDMQKVKKLGARHSTELERKFDRQITFLDGTKTSLELVTDKNFLNENTIHYSIQNQKKVDLVFEKWLDNLPVDEKKKYKTDAVELVMRGWMGPVKLVSRKKTYCEKFQSVCRNLRQYVAPPAELGQPDIANGFQSGPYKRSRSRSSSPEFWN